MKKIIVSLLIVFIILTINYSYATTSDIEIKLYDIINYSDKDDSGTINIGDEITIGTESFYILSNKDSVIRAIAKYNLDVGYDCVNYIKTEKVNPTEIQNAEDKGSSGSSNIGTGKGTVPFSSGDTNYDNSSIKEYIDTYANYLKSNYNIDVTADLITQEELMSYGFKWSNGNTGIYSQYKWLYSTSYWTKTKWGDSNVIYVTYDGFFNRIGPENDALWGVRPVINFNEKYLKSILVNIKSDNNGRINISNENNKIYITILPNESYELDTLHIKSDTSEYEPTKISDDYYFFIVNEECKKIEIDSTYKKIEPPHTHTYKTTTTKATLSNNGSIVEKCSCGNVKSTTVIPKITTVKLSKASFTYNKKVQKPTITIKDSKSKVLKEGTDYTIKYSNKSSKKIGKYTVTVTFKGNYTGSKKFTYTVKPKGTSLKKLTKGKKQFKARWNKQTTETTGYQVQYSTKKDFSSGNKSKTVSKNKTISATIKSLKNKKKYYVRIRTYKTVNGKKIYSGWSKVLNIKTK